MLFVQIEILSPQLFAHIIFFFYFCISIVTNALVFTTTLIAEIEKLLSQ